MKIKYFADDGKEFDTENECIAHESELKREKEWYTILNRYGDKAFDNRLRAEFHQMHIASHLAKVLAFDVPVPSCYIDRRKDKSK
jgi:hypothetical protein